MMFNHDSLIRDRISADLKAIFENHDLTFRYTDEDNSGVNRGFRPPIDDSRTVPAASKDLLSVSMLLFVLIFLAEFGPYFTVSSPPAKIGLPVAPHQSQESQDLPKTMVADITPDGRSRHTPTERASAEPALAPASLFGSLAKPAAMRDKAKQAREIGPRRVAEFARHEVKVRQPGKQLAAATSLVRSDGDCASLPDRSVEAQSCWGEKLMWAHDRLVTSYNDAAHAGVPRSQLVHYRNEWLSARRTSRVDPADTIRDYRKLSGGLQEAARMAQSANDEDNYEAND